MDYLIAMELSQCQRFLSDIVNPDLQPKFIGQNIPLLTLQKLKSWQIIDNAKTQISPNYRLDNFAINNLTIARSSNSFTTNIGGTLGINALLVANKYMPCATCKNNNNFLQIASEYISDVNYFSDNYNNANLWADLKQPNAIKTVYGAAFQLRILREHPYLFAGGTLSFDASLIDDTDADNPGNDDPNVSEFRSKCRYDIKVEKSTGINYFEFKSWSNNFANTFLNNSPIERTAFANQLKTYLTQINNLSQLKYMFDGKRITEIKAKQVLQKVFEDKANEWFDGGSFETKIISLFGTANKQVFLSKVNDTNNLIYQFVKTY